MKEGTFFLDCSGTGLSKAKLSFFCAFFYPRTGLGAPPTFICSIPPSVQPAELKFPTLFCTISRCYSVICSASSKTAFPLVCFLASFFPPHVPHHLQPTACHSSLSNIQIYSCFSSSSPPLFFSFCFSFIHSPLHSTPPVISCHISARCIYGPPKHRHWHPSLFLFSITAKEQYFIPGEWLVKIVLHLFIVLLFPLCHYRTALPPTPTVTELRHPFPWLNAHLNER